MRVLVTGASGFVGLNLVEHFLGAGHEVTAISVDSLHQRTRSAFKALDGSFIHVELDLRDTGRLRDTIFDHRPERVVAGAAITPGEGAEAGALSSVVEVNILAALRTLELAAEAGAERGIFLSSASVYGLAPPHGGAFDEAESAPQPVNAYGISKLAAEQFALRMGAIRGFDTRAVRIGTVFGPWERDTGLRETMSPIFQVMQHFIAGSPIILPREGRRDFIYARDVAAAVAAILDAPEARGPYNLGLGREWTVAEWCACLAAREDFSWRIAGPGEAPNVDYHSASDRPPLAIYRLRREVGFSPAYGLEEALEDYLSWLRPGVAS